MRFPDLQLQHRAGRFITQNSSGILTAGGVIGVGITAILTARASFKAAAIIREKVALAQIAAEEQGEDFSPDLTKMEMARIVWPCYIVPAATGVSTIVAVVMANRMSAKRAAALAAAYSISESRLQEYKDKVTHRLGFAKERNIRDEIAQERVTENPPKEVIILGTGDVLCFDSLTGRYFNSSVEIVKRAEHKIHLELFNTQSASLTQFFDEIGLEPTLYSDTVGWNTVHDEPFEIRFSTTITPDNRPCLVVDYSVMPKPDFNKLY
jgi:uncharacterized protein DUF6353